MPHARVSTALCRCLTRGSVQRCADVSRAGQYGAVPMSHARNSTGRQAAVHWLAQAAPLQRRTRGLAQATGEQAAAGSAVWQWLCARGTVRRGTGCARTVQCSVALGAHARYSWAWHWVRTRGTVRRGSGCIRMVQCGVAVGAYARYNGAWQWVRTRGACLPAPSRGGTLIQDLATSAAQQSRSHRSSAPGGAELAAGNP
jgi:hypothetical protein